MTKKEKEEWTKKFDKWNGPYRESQIGSDIYRSMLKMEWEKERKKNLEIWLSACKSLSFN